MHTPNISYVAFSTISFGTKGIQCSIAAYIDCTSRSAKTMSNFVIYQNKIILKKENYVCCNAFDTKLVTKTNNNGKHPKYLTSALATIFRPL